LITCKELNLKAIDLMNVAPTHGANAAGNYYFYNILDKTTQWNKRNS
jgi:hypothetical protein